MTKKLLMTHKILFLICLMLSNVILFGQSYTEPKITFIASDTVAGITSDLYRTTNFNSSIYLGDTSIAIPHDSLRSDGTATIITVYETDEDSIVGLWQIGSDSNRVLWLNSQHASYDDFSLRYRTDNEHGVIVHTMLYAYPVVDSQYDGRDTLFIGREDSNIGDKNFCALYYFKGSLPASRQRVLESMLAIRYGALLHGPYVSSRHDILWNTLLSDSLYGFGVCGIGRDDSTGLLQTRSVIRGDILTLCATSPMDDTSFVMMGHDGGGLAFDDEGIWVDSVRYLSVSRTWKLRSNAGYGSLTVSLTANMPFSANAIRLLISSEDGSSLYEPAIDSLLFDSIALVNSSDYYVTILVNADSVSSTSKGAKSSHGNEETDYTNANINSSSNQKPQFTISPNPTSGHFTLNVKQSDDDVVNITIHDAQGRIIEQHIVTESSPYGTYEGMLHEDGIYYVTVTINGRCETIKLIVIR